MTNKRRRLTGTVVSNKMDKTVVVEVERTFSHPLYGKIVREARRFMAHDEENECEMGDTVVIVESRPISRHKRWAVQDIVRSDLSAQTEEVGELAGMDQTVIEDEPVVEAQAAAPAEEEDE